MYVCSLLLNLAMSPASINKEPIDLRVCIVKSQCSNKWDRGGMRTAKSYLVEYLKQNSHPKPFYKRMIFKRRAKPKQGRTDKLANNAKPTIIFLFMLAETKQNKTTLIPVPILF